MTTDSTSVTPLSTIEILIAGSGFDANADGGDFNVSWDSGVLSFVDITIADPPWDTTFLDTGSAAAGFIDSVFLGTSPLGGVGPEFEIATLSFDVVGAAGSNTTITLADALVGWFAPGANSIDVSYDELKITVVPLPGAAVLFGAALLAMTAFGRRGSTECES